MGVDGRSHVLVCLDQKTPLCLAQNTPTTSSGRRNRRRNRRRRTRKRRSCSNYFSAKSFGRSALYLSEGGFGVDGRWWSPRKLRQVRGRVDQQQLTICQRTRDIDAVFHFGRNTALPAALALFPELQFFLKEAKQPKSQKGMAKKPKAS